MAQSDQTIQNASFPNVRADINDNLEALFTQSSGASEPTTKVAFQPWVDTSTSPPTWKIRNAANSGWITVGVLDPANFGVGGVTPIANGGTGQTTVAAAIAALLPSQTGNADKALLTNGTSLLWGAITASSFTKYTFAAGTGTGSTRTHLWTKPGTGSTAVVLVWGGGGAGGKDENVGGGGGAGSNCGFGLFPLADLGSTETITLGQGGQGRSDSDNDGAGANGTNSTFGSHVTSYGGRGGDDDNSKTAFGSTPFSRGALETLVLSSQPAFDLFSGGNGGKQQGDNDSGGNAVFGGAGGGNAGINNSADPAGGTSIIAGSGGKGNRAQADAVDGSTPGGGGGGSQEGAAGSGGDGECWVLIF